MIPKYRLPAHPGEILFEEFILPRKMTQVDLARKIKVPIQRINTLIHGKRDMTPETAILLAGFFKTSPEFWMNSQTQREIAIAQQRIATV